MKRVFQGWSLFVLLTLAGSAVVIVFWVLTSLTGEAQFRHMIGVSVLSSFPLLLLTFIASAAARGWRVPLTTWLLRNRKFFGLAFSAVMLWQILFIERLIAVGGRIFPPGLGTYFIVSDLIGYTFLLAMTVTSFDPVRSRMSRRAWTRLHRIGIYYVWFIYAYSFLLGAYFTHGRTALGYAVLSVVAWAAAGLRGWAWHDRRLAQHRSGTRAAGVADSY
jgi:methionine sulfoxide reductase heme-binding subunit